MVHNRSIISHNIDSGCFPSPHLDAFPAGLRVLVVDDDPTWLRILEKMLKKCFYQVTTCCLAIEALKKLREKKDAYDIVISDVNMPDMDGFKLLEHVGLEMDLPVIMMSVDGETSRVMKGVQHGACDYLLKPIRMKELRNIWQHVLRKRIHEAREFETFEGIHLMRNGSNHIDDGNLFAVGGEMNLMKKRKDLDNKHDDKEFGDQTSLKKARVIWSVDLHQKFVKAVNRIGFDKIGPKKILDLMNVPWLTRENVASHLQKYRLYLSRLQKENDQKYSTGGIKYFDLPSKDSGCVSFLDSLNKQQNDGAIDNFRYSDGTLKLHMESTSHEVDLNGIVTRPTIDKIRASVSDIIDPKIRKCSQIGHNQPYESAESEVNHTVFEYSTVSTQCSWNEVPKMLLKEEQNTQKHFQIDQSQSMNSDPSGYTSDYISPVNSMALEVVTFPSQSKSLVANDQSPDIVFTSNLSSKAPGYNLGCISDMEIYQRNLLLDSHAALTPLDEDLHLLLLQGEYYNMNFGMQNIEMSEYSDPWIIAEVPTNLYDSADYS
ncbi:two-component response regulator ARR11-like [Trifolium pratense]|uniref:Uncharacterized protein n=1 Tax=Trifolium pratense TaxID=57577 RepID=A0ACB0M6X2_TRIPR|nr:two-component response regulator ARR11-like [Trifolium pratense]CAJ2677629.1 unnamed protein product [Trifolium pratense]